MCFPLFVGVLCLSLFCYALLCVLSSFAINLKRNRKLVALLLLSYRCIVTINVLWLFLVGLQFVIVVFPDHTHLLFGVIIRQPTKSCTFVGGRDATGLDRTSTVPNRGGIVNIRSSTVVNRSAGVRSRSGFVDESCRHRRSIVRHRN